MGWLLPNGMTITQWDGYYPMGWLLPYKNACHLSIFLFILDGFVKSPTSALRCNLRYCSVLFFPCSNIPDLLRQLTTQLINILLGPLFVLDTYDCYYFPKYLTLSNLYKARAMPVKNAIMIDKNRRIILPYSNDMHMYFGNVGKSAAA